MMTAFSAVYTNFKPVPSRKVVSITLEAPIEHGDEIIKLLGMPNPDESKWVGVARLNEAVRTVPTVSTPSPSSEGTDSKRTWDQMSYAQRAGIMSNDPEFWEYTGALDKDMAADLIRRICHVQSRSEILPGTQAEDWFLHICERFDTWKKFERGR